jgi:membrane protease YdiL (CAAX protease family)
VLTGTVTAVKAPAPIIRATAPQLLDTPVVALIVSLAGISLALPLVLAVTRWIGARPVGTLASVTGRLRWRWLGWCMLFAFLTTVVFLLFAVVVTWTSGSVSAADNDPPVVSVTSATLIALVVCLPVVVTVTVVQSAAEEFVARGWLLQAVGGFTAGPWPAIGVQAGVFTVLHGFNGNVWGYAGLIGYAMLIGWLTVSTGGIEAGIALHVVSNVCMAIPTCFILIFTDIGRDTDANYSEASWQLSMAHLCVAAGFAVIVTVAARRQGIATTVPALPPTSVPAPDTDASSQAQPRDQLPGTPIALSPGRPGPVMPPASPRSSREEQRP